MWVGAVLFDLNEIGGGGFFGAAGFARAIGEILCPV